MNTYPLRSSRSWGRSAATTPSRKVTPHGSTTEAGLRDGLAPPNDGQIGPAACAAPGRRARPEAVPTVRGSSRIWMRNADRAVGRPVLGTSGPADGHIADRWRALLPSLYGQVSSRTVPA